MLKRGGKCQLMKNKIRVLGIVEGYDMLIVRRPKVSFFKSDILDVDRFSAILLPYP